MVLLFEASCFESLDIVRVTLEVIWRALEGRPDRRLLVSVHLAGLDEELVPDDKMGPKEVAARVLCLVP